MKKFLLALPILTVPLIAQAQDKPTQAPRAVIEATEKRFLPNLCAKGIERLAADAYDCYQQINSTDPKQEECLIADFMVTSTITKMNKKAAALGQTPQYNMPFFTYMEIGKRARNFIEKSSKFKNYTTLEFARYLANSFTIIMNDFDKSNTRTNHNCSAFYKPE